MIVRIGQIYDRAAAENNLDRSLVESIGSFTFRYLRNELELPTEIAYEFPKFGIFILRQKRFLSKVDRIRNKPVKTEHGIKRKAIFLEAEKKVLQFKEKKQQVKAIKDEYKSNKPN